MKDKKRHGFITRLLARYLVKTSPGYQPLSVVDPEILKSAIQPGDILLVEGNQRISIAIKYLTQSTWSHAALYTGVPGEELIEADLLHGVVAVPLSKYARFHTRICRPVGLSEEDREKILHYVTSRIGMEYDLSNAIDMMRYLLPEPPVPVRWRRHMLKAGSGAPTRAICSTLIANAFDSVGYPILPRIDDPEIYERIKGTAFEDEIRHIRSNGLYAPRDFDLSPYFSVVKPTIENGFDYRIPEVKNSP